MHASTATYSKPPSETSEAQASNLILMAPNGSVRSSPFLRPTSQPPPPTTPNHDRSRPQSMIIPPSQTSTNMAAHARNQSYSSMQPPNITNGTSHTRHKLDTKAPVSRSNTFAPSFIKSEEVQRRESEAVNSIEGENDFSGKRYVWVNDAASAFVKGWIVEELEGGMLLVQCDDGSVRRHSAYYTYSRTPS